jgi:hypothetical protein
MSQQTSPSSGSVRTSTVRWKMLDTRHWRSICDLTLTLKQGLCSAVPPDNALGSKNSHMWIPIDEAQSKKAFRHFINLLNRAVYGNAVHRHGKRLRVIGVVEKDGDGRWHIHAAIEPPMHGDAPIGVTAGFRFATTRTKDGSLTCSRVPKSQDSRTGLIA